MFIKCLPLLYYINQVDINVCLVTMVTMLIKWIWNGQQLRSRGGSPVSTNKVKVTFFTSCSTGIVNSSNDILLTNMAATLQKPANSEMLTVLKRICINMRVNKRGQLAYDEKGEEYINLYIFLKSNGVTLLFDTTKRTIAHFTILSTSNRITTRGQ